MKTKNQIRKRIKVLKSQQKSCSDINKVWICGKYHTKGNRFINENSRNRYHSLQDEIDTLQWVLREE